MREAVWLNVSRPNHSDAQHACPLRPTPGPSASAGESQHVTDEAEKEQKVISPVDAAPDDCGQIMTNECFDDIQEAVRKDVDDMISHAASGAGQDVAAIRCENVLRHGLPASCGGLGEEAVRTRIVGGGSSAPFPPKADGALGDGRAD